MTVFLMPFAEMPFDDAKIIKKNGSPTAAVPCL
jgi:hypothetical protein